MIKLEARIKLFDSDDGVINNAQIDHNNNISWPIYTANSSFGKIVGREEKQSRPFLLGKTPLIGGVDAEIPKTAEMYLFKDKVTYFIGNLVSQADGTFTNGDKYTITIHGEAINGITLVFDKDGEVWPTEVVANRITYANDDATLTIGNLGGVSTLTIEISKLNKPNVGLILTGIYIDVTILVDETNLDSFTYSIYDRDSNDEPSYGIISNSGTLSFIDGTGEVLDYAKQNILTENLIVEISVLNTLAQKRELFVKTHTGTWSYDNYNMVASVSLQDELLELQQYSFNGFPFDGMQTTGKDIYEAILAQSPDNIMLPKYESLDDNTKLRLLYPISYAYMDSCSIWTALDELAKTFGLRIYKDKDKIILEASA